MTRGFVLSEFKHSIYSMANLIQVSSYERFLLTTRYIYSYYLRR